MYEGYFLFFTFLSLIIAVISLIFSYRNEKRAKRTVGDSIKHELINLPPYESEGDTSTIIVKNVGNTMVKPLRTCVLFDWNEDLKIEHEYEGDEDVPFILPLNREETFKTILPLPPSKGEYHIEVCTCTEDSNEAYSNKFRALL